MAAAAAISLGAALAPDIIRLIVSLVQPAAQQAEAKYPVSGSGPVKFADVYGAVMISLQQAAAVGTIPKALPPDETIKAIVETVVTTLNLSGLLAGAPVAATSAAPPNTVTLKPGQSVTIQVQS